MEVRFEKIGKVLKMIFVSLGIIMEKSFTKSFEKSFRKA
jgi:hypothetical protein